MELAVSATSAGDARGVGVSAYTDQCAALKSAPLNISPWPRSDRLNAHFLAAAKHVKLVRRVQCKRRHEA